MGLETGITWCDSTWNPFVGCIKVGEGCKNCYMYREQTRYGADPTVIRRTKPRTFNSPLRWKEPKVIFVCSWSDFFLKEVDRWRDDAWKIIKEANQHTYLLLTKRAERIKNCLPADWNNVDYGHVWLGVTSENRAEYANRELMLASLNMSLKLEKRTFISFEPLLEDIRIGMNTEIDNVIMTNLGWAIVGGESGGKVAREMDSEWARKIKRECAKHDIPFFFKQMTNHAPIPDDLSLSNQKPRMGK